MNAEQIKSILALHKLYLNKKKGGKRADLHCANLRSANLSDANLRGANLNDADLHCADLHCADLRNANLSDANLRSANLSDANLRGANLRGANLRGANLRGADLRDADLDYSSGIPMWCGGRSVKLDRGLWVQQLNHLLSHTVDISGNEDIVKLRNDALKIANEFYRVGCEELKEWK